MKTTVITTAIIEADTTEAVSRLPLIYKKWLFFFYFADFSENKFT
jgi:hypothetical protein